VLDESMSKFLLTCGQSHDWLLFLLVLDNAERYKAVNSIFKRLLEGNEVAVAERLEN
jgi:hypothetical protein